MGLSLDTSGRRTLNLASAPLHLGEAPGGGFVSFLGWGTPLGPNWWWLLVSHVCLSDGLSLGIATG